MSGSLFDFGLYLFHNAKELLARGSGPYFYLPKLESHLEARLWNDVFVRAQQLIGIPQGSIRATVLIETILATFEMDEILYELRNHSAGLNCGRWDYIFSFIKKFSASQDLLFPDRSQVTMTSPFMRAYAKLTIKTCHHRNAPAIGGMSAFIPIKSDPVANDTAIAQVRADKEREATDGHDGTWVAHPGLVPVAKEVFDRIMPQPNQISKQLPDFQATAAELLAIPTGTITYNGLKHNIAVGLGYLEAWMRGTGCVPLFNLMEDAATAEISRAQLWQWVHHHAVLQDPEHKRRARHRLALPPAHRRRSSPQHPECPNRPRQGLPPRRRPHPQPHRRPQLPGVPHPPRLHHHPQRGRLQSLAPHPTLYPAGSVVLTP